MLWGVAYPLYVNVDRAGLAVDAQNLNGCVFYQWGGMRWYERAIGTHRCA